MFEKAIQAQLKRIFDFDKVTFDTPGESEEQEGLYIEVQSAITRLRDGLQSARVKGVLHVFASSEKLPYGYFLKAIAKAKPEDTRNFFFFNLEENKGTYRDIVERSVDFLYFFNGQYDPALGTITSVDLSIAENL